MTKKITNLTVNEKIRVTSKLVDMTGTTPVVVVNRGGLYNFNKGVLLFVKLDMDLAKTNNRLGEGYFDIIGDLNLDIKDIRLLKTNLNNIYDDTILAAAQSLSIDENVEDRIIIEGKKSTDFAINNISRFRFDISKLVGELNYEDRYQIIFAVAVKALKSDTKFSIYNPEEIKEQAEICGVNITRVSGLNNLYKYDKKEIGPVTEYINLFTGSLITIIKTVSTKSNKTPLGLNIAYNRGKENSLNLINNRLTTSAQYEIVKNSDIYYIEDYTGARKYYYFKTISKSQELIKMLGIKHLEGYQTFYLCEEDYSYLLENQNGEITEIKVYNKIDDLVEFTISNGLTKIKKVKTKTSDIIYRWTNNKLTTILDNLNTSDKLYISYDELSRIKEIKTNQQQNYKVTISYTSGGYEFTYYINDLQASKLVYEDGNSELTINYHKTYGVTEEDKIVTIHKNSFLIYDRVELSESQIKVANEEVKVTAKKYYEYYKGLTKSTDIFGNKLYYYFGNAGTCEMIMDGKARIKSYEYSNNFEIPRLIRESDVQNNGKCLIENASFESDNNLFEKETLGWKISGNVASKLEVRRGGVYKQRYLHISHEESETIVITQDLKNIEQNNYELVGFVKLKQTEENNKVKLKLALKGSYNLNQNTVNYQKEVEETKETINFKKLTTGKLTLPEGITNLKMQIEITITGGKGEVSLDDFKLYPNENNSIDNIIENGHLESIKNQLPIGYKFENISTDRTVDGIVFNDCRDEHLPVLGNYVMHFSSCIEDTNINKTMTKEIKIRGKANDVYTFSAFGKGEVTSNQTFKISIIATKSSIRVGYKEIEFRKNFDQWQAVIGQMETTGTYDKIVVKISYNGTKDVYVDCIQLRNSSYGINYSYDKSGNLSEIIENNKSINLLYGDNNALKKVINANGTSYDLEYNEEGNLKEIKNVNGIKIEYIYDNNQNVTETKVYNNQECLYSTKATYDSNNNKTSTTDEFGKITRYEYEKVNTIKNIKYSNQLIKEYKYDELDNLKKVLMSKKSGSTTNNLQANEIAGYNALNDIVGIGELRGTRYTYTYDKYGRIVEIACGENNKTLEKYGYKERSNTYIDSIIYEHELGNNTGKKTKYYYDDEDRVIKITKQAEDEEEIINYQYDEMGNVSQAQEVKNGTEHYYSYNEDKLIRYINSNDEQIEYEYDKLNNVQSINYRNNQYQRTYDYFYDYETTNKTITSYFNKLNEKYQNEIVLAGKTGNGMYGLYQKENTAKINSEKNYDTYVFKDKYDSISYDLDTANVNRANNYFKSEFISDKTILLWILPTSQTIVGQENIIIFGKNIVDSQGSLTNKSIANLYVTEDGKLAYRTSGSTTLKGETTSMIKPNEWNLIGISINRKNQNKKSHCKIMLNEEITSSFEIDEKVEDIKYLTIANKLETNTTIQTTSNQNPNDNLLKIPFELTMIMIGIDQYTQSDIKQIYREGKEVLTANISTQGYGMSYEQKDKIKEGYELISLNGNAVSTNGRVPTINKTVELTSNDKDGMFITDTILRRMVYYNNITKTNQNALSVLAYELGLKEEGTVSLRFKYDEKLARNNNTIITFKKEQTEILSFYFNESKNLKVSINGKEVASNIIISEDWNSLTFTYKNNMLLYYINGVRKKAMTLTKIDLTSSTTYIGNINEYGEKTYSGRFEKLIFNNEYSSDIECQRLNKIDTINIYYGQNQLGQVVRKEIDTGKNKIQINYEYDKTRISKEKHKDEDIAYTYNEVGKISRRQVIKANEVIEDVSYEYNELGMLIKEQNNLTDQIKEYEYDGNGDRTAYCEKKGEIVEKEYDYSYNDDDEFDALTRIKDIKNNKTYYITYDANKCGQPIKMWLKEKEQNLLWEDKNLIQIGEHIKYSYNTEGIRTKKETEEGTTEYSLIGSKIMKMEKVTSSGKITMYFTYDQRDELQSVTESNKEYYYIKDITGNIIKIKDEEGNSIVEYKYDAYGKVEKTIIENNNVSKYNPFIYKGYYYDEETELYYCNTRYYSPEIGRWISIDDVSTLNPSSINGLNLYSYANNNPINIHYNTTLASAGFVGGGMLSSIGSSVGGGLMYVSGSGNLSSPSRNLSSVPGWLGTLSTGLDHGFTIINPIRSAIACLQFTDLWDLMRLDGVTELPGTLSKVATGIGWGLSIAGGAIIVGWAIIAVVAGIAINHLFTKLEIGGNTIEGHLNDFVDWLIFWD